MFGFSVKARQKTQHYAHNVGRLQKDQKFYQVRFHCPKWEVDLRIPVADYTPSAPSFEKRHVHAEFLKLRLEEARLDVPRFDPDSLGTNALLNIYCAAIQGEYCMFYYLVLGGKTY